jgi:prefoldin alpha subunit
MAAEDDMDRLAADLQLQQSKGESIHQQIMSMQESLMEMGGAVNALQNLKNMKGDALVPLGAGVFLSCPKPNPEKIIINIGANVMVQKSPEDAVKLLEERQKGIRGAINSAQEDLELTLNAIEEISKKANALAAQGEGNVRPAKE